MGGGGGNTTTFQLEREFRAPVVDLWAVVLNAVRRPDSLWPISLSRAENLLICTESDQRS